MSTINCSSCDELRNNASVFVTSGVTEETCTSLENNTGFNPHLEVQHDDATDLHDANDCLIGMMDAQIEAYEVCDWKEYMHKFVRNLYELLKAIICSLSGLWKKVTTMEDLCETTGDVLDIALQVADEINGTVVTDKLTDHTPDGTAHIAVKARTVTANICGERAVVDLFTAWMGGGWTAVNLPQGEVLATWEKSQLVPDYMHESTWNSILTNHYYTAIGVFGDEYVVYADMGETAGYEGKMAMRATSISPDDTANGTVHTIQNRLTAFRIV